ncbi:exonuclease domain-containing protein [Aquimarina brevivitae]|uniref:DNA polymerase-3 subunit epsilon n=1 Tax=Aquimarina brevivitae TaxID=323412 RepID=A0A4Q7NZ20_9FLAO|nr:exonuclease domain-containing protein [Aquimarina brevivitae]RZS92595.1 DNA polymerase-3 subunit epsilon [Aquimarina brevivitae]
MYAVVDIETTGGKYNEEGITEIAIYRFDGHQVVDKFVSLINPERPIQPFVANLTGIKSEMLRNAPKFYEVAKRIVEITKDCVIVAHNASFDYRILRTEFARLGYEYERRSLCTVELSKKLIPDQNSYSLGKLVRGLGIPLSDRHRADGDAQATVKLFKLLLVKDGDKQIISDTVRLDPKRQLDNKLLMIIENAPATTGVYYMYNEDGDIIYIGKSRNIKKRLNQHFTNDNKKSKKIQQEVVEVTYDITGSELVALLKESEEIKKINPIYNKALKRNSFTQALYQFKDKNGYLNLTINKIDKRKEAVTVFTNRQQAKANLLKWIEEYRLCQKLTNLDKSNGNCFYYTIKECNGACILEEDHTAYNTRVEELVDNHSFRAKSLLILDKGRTIDEQSVIVIEQGKFKGIAYINLNYQLHNKEVLQNILTKMDSTKDAINIIQAYIRKNKKVKIHNLEH